MRTMVNSYRNLKATCTSVYGGFDRTEIENDERRRAKLKENGDLTHESGPTFNKIEGV